MTVTDNRAQAHRDAGTTERAAQQRASRFAGSLRGRLLQLVIDAGDAGLTATEAYELYRPIYGDPPGGLYSLAPRLSELERTGHVEKAWVRDRRAAYRATDKGQRAMRALAGAA